MSFVADIVREAMDWREHIHSDPEILSGKPDGGRLSALASMFDAGQLRVNLQEVVPLEEAARAHETVEEGHTRGKVVLGVE
jgi:NADPH:quinone reductase-like Zn-dependent oxidoreductase